MNNRLNHIAVFVLGLVVLLTGASALARQDSTAGFSSGGDIGLRVGAVGLGNRARPGDWAAIQVEVLHRSSNPKPMAVIIRTDIPNDDGDRAEVQRVVVTNPNRPVTTWLFARLPFTFDLSSTLTVSAYVPFDQEAGSDTLGAYDRTKPVGSITLNTQALISENSGLIGIVGRRPSGIDRYAEKVGTTTDVPVTGHELTSVADGLTPAVLPDRVHGLRAFEALVWTGATADEQPGKLNVAQADAIREWVAGGGHLVVVVPIVGQTWIDTPNPLSEIMPKVHVERREGVSLDAMRYLITTKEKAALPASSILQVFMPDVSAGPFDATPILLTDKGEILVVRRQVGIGAVTLVGLDAPNLASTLSVLRTDAFWNRVLGKRLELPTRKEHDDAMNASQIVSSFNRQDVWFEKSIPASINWESEAAVGLLVAVVVFGGFWLVAGPVGFFVLKQRQKTQHSWVAYAAAILAFTAVSWSAATVMRQRTPKIRHITMLDHVYGQPCQRARVWANVFLPSYGTARVSVQKKAFDLAGRPLEPNPAIAAWESPTGASGGTEFPESRSYVVDARSPDSIDFPARSTTRQMQIDWLGAPRLSMPLPLAADGQPSEMGEELKLLLDTPQGLPERWTVTGTLQHDLPAPLRNVVIIVNRGQAAIAPPKKSGALTSDAGIFVLKDAWEPGKPLDLGKATHHLNDPLVRAERYLDDLTPKGSTGYFGNAQIPEPKEDIGKIKGGIVGDLTMLSLYSMLAPPDLRTPADNRCNARRATSQTLDLGRWFTEPCVIVIGFLGSVKGDKGDCPVPIEVDGREVPSEGITCVRWVYPLKAAAPEYAEITQSTDPSGKPLGPEEGDK